MCFVGLAAALQARVLAQLKVKEESEERQRISDETSHSRAAHSDLSLQINAPPSQHIKTESTFNLIHMESSYNYHFPNSDFKPETCFADRSVPPPSTTQDNALR